VWMVDGRAADFGELANGWARRDAQLGPLVNSNQYEKPESGLAPDGGIIRLGKRQGSTMAFVP